MNFFLRLWDELPHILYRGQLHYFYAIGLVIFVFFGLRSLLRRIRRSEKYSKYMEWLPTSHGSTLLYADFLIIIVAMSREPLDVSHGQWVFKAYTDYLSWMLGLVTGNLLAYRLIWLDWRDR